MKRTIIFIILCCGLLANVQGAIVHRYDFGGDPNDTVGTADGVLFDNTGRAAYADGQLTLGNQGIEHSNDNDGDYINLPNGIISALGDQATFETWTTWRGSGTWERIFDLGTSDGGEDQSPGAGGSMYIFLTPQGGPGVLRFGMNNPLPSRVEMTINDTAPLATETEQHVVISWDGANGNVSMYLNGNLVNEGQMHFALSDLDDNNNWLGRAQWNDSMYVGSYNEFRIYDHAMSGSEVAASLEAGTEVSIASPVYPVEGDDEVAQLPTLEWASGYVPSGSPALGYKIYLSADEADVASGSPDALETETANTSYTLAVPLDTDSTYFWRVDQMVILPGNTEPNDIAGGVVSFETIKTFPELSTPSALFGLIDQSVEITVQIVSLTEVTGADWYLYVDGGDDQPIPDDDKYDIVTTGEETTLVINDIAEANAGEYYCIVTNSAGGQMSNNIALSVRRGLAHRYSFSHEGLADADPNVIDSAGSANGELINNTGNAVFADGQLTLGNTGGQNSNGNTETGKTNGDYVDLPNGMISALGNLATFEMWVTWGGPAWGWWQRIFDFGTSDGGEDTSGGAGNSYYVMMTPWGGERFLRTGYRRGIDATEWILDDLIEGQLTVGKPTHIALVWNGDTSTIQMYRDGQLMSQGGIHFALSDMPDNNNWLARAQFGDSLFTGSYDEFRIYDVPLTADQVLAHYQAGPDVLGVEVPCPGYAEGDVNKDCKVDLIDLAILADTWLD